MAKDKKLIRKWIKALQSGKFYQGQSSLKYIGSQKFCCLGVACAVSLGYKTGRHVSKDKITEASGGSSATIYDNTPLYKALGLTDKKQGKLMYMNDTEGKTFKEIAKYIRKEILNG